MSNYYFRQPITLFKMMGTLEPDQDSGRKSVPGGLHILISRIQTDLSPEPSFRLNGPLIRTFIPPSIQIFKILFRQIPGRPPLQPEAMSYSITYQSFRSPRVLPVEPRPGTLKAHQFPSQCGFQSCKGLTHILVSHWEGGGCERVPRRLW